MLKEAIEKILSLGATDTKVIGTLNYADKGLTILNPPTPQSLKVTSLAALADLTKSSFEGIGTDAHIFHVVSHAKVNILPAGSDPYGQRPVLVTAELPETDKFTFGAFYESEKFIIALQSTFVKTEDLDYVLQMSSKLTAETVAQAEDNGIAQVATIRKGASGALKEQTLIRPRVKLAPYRTFREVDQPASEFLFRLRGGDAEKAPECALFEADGGAWKLAAIQNIAYFLKSALPAKAVIVA